MTVFRFREEGHDKIVIYAEEVTFAFYPDNRVYHYTGARPARQVAVGTVTESRLAAAYARAYAYDSPAIIDFTHPTALYADGQPFYWDTAEASPPIQDPGQIAVFEAPAAVNTTGTVAFTVKAPS